MSVSSCSSHSPSFSSLSTPPSPVQEENENSKVLSPIPKKPLMRTLATLVQSLELDILKEREIEQARCFIEFSNAFLRSQKIFAIDQFKATIDLFSINPLLYSKMEKFHKGFEVDYMNRIISAHLEEFTDDDRIREMFKKATAFKDAFNAYCITLTEQKLFGKTKDFADEVQKAGQLKKIMAIHPFIQEVTSLQLENCDLRLLPREILFFSKLKTINLIGNRLSYLPEELRLIPGIQVTIESNSPAVSATKDLISLRDLNEKKI